MSILDDITIRVKNQKGEWGNVTIQECIYQNAYIIIYKFLLRKLTGEDFPWQEPPSEETLKRIFTQLHDQELVTTHDDVKPFVEALEKQFPEGVPYLAIGNEELQEKKVAGKYAKCNNCGKKHKIEYKDGGTQIGLVHCGDKSFLVAINGRLL